MRVLYFSNNSCHAFCVPHKSVNKFAYLRNKVECKESRVGKKPIQVPSNVSLTFDGQFISVKGPLGELSRTYSSDIIIEREDSILKVRKAVETRRANEMHGLFRCNDEIIIILLRHYAYVLEDDHHLIWLEIVMWVSACKLLLGVTIGKL
jgi:Ribosomal protein L6